MGRISDWLDEFSEILDITLFNKWLWIIILSMCAIIVMPLAIMWFVLMVPQWLAATITIFIIVGWGAAAGYKDYLQFKRKTEKDKAQRREFDSSDFD